MTIFLAKCKFRWYSTLGWYSLEKSYQWSNLMKDITSRRQVIIPYESRVYRGRQSRLFPWQVFRTLRHPSGRVCQPQQGFSPGGGRRSTHTKFWFVWQIIINVWCSFHYCSRRSDQRRVGADQSFSGPGKVYLSLQRFPKFRYFLWNNRSRGLRLFYPSNVSI